MDLRTTLRGVASRHRRQWRKLRPARTRKDDDRSQVRLVGLDGGFGGFSQWALDIVNEYCAGNSCWSKILDGWAGDGSQKKMGAIWYLEMEERDLVACF